ncbi:MAG: hypothetical protein HXN53_00110 [Prevotella nigrescens]|uniref:hypothetical protein n=1 Tax=Prevotella nigrescens TaxID=28133 RepID=UPI000B4D4E30|nr:hypothetical protein [Prevotella nigrescens]MBF1444150.1 hypothetical protein [Prevotella nigrescens]OWP29090.1 hypothetical protein CBG57_12045 [Prevotella nigrescens]
MERVISKESVLRGNAKTIRGLGRSVSVDGNNVSVRYKAMSGEYLMTFSRNRIADEARKAYAKIVR